GAEEGPARHQPLPGAQLAQQGREHRRHAARRGAARLGPLDEAQPLLEHRHGRVAVARIDVTRAVLLEGSLGLGGAAIDKARGQEQGLRGLLVGAALAAAAHQEGCGGELGGKLEREDRLWHHRFSIRNPCRSRTQKPWSAAGQGSFKLPDLLAQFFTWRASRSAQIPTAEVSYWAGRVMSRRTVAMRRPIPR